MLIHPIFTLKKKSYLTAANIPIGMSWLNRQEFERTPGDSGRQKEPGVLQFMGHKESDAATDQGHHSQQVKCPNFCQPPLQEMPFMDSL